jgi:large subunit ribosomal protein L6
VSRIGRMPVKIPAGVKVSIEGATVKVHGPQGELVRSFPSGMGIEQVAGEVRISRSADDPKSRATHGMTRALLHNMVMGVSQGFTKDLQVEGVGYRAELKAGKLVLSLGFSHPIDFPPPAGVSFVVDEKARTIQVKGFDREQVGQVAADIRKLRPPEPYKGKGIRYVGERVRHKAGKAGKAAAK